MHDAVFAERPGRYRTVGEMLRVTVDQARLFTDPHRQRGRLARGVAGSVFEYYRSLISLRHAEPAVVHVDSGLLADHPTIFAVEWRPARVLISNHQGTAERFEPDGVALRPWEALVLRRWVRQDRRGQ